MRVAIGVAAVAYGSLVAWHVWWVQREKIRKRRQVLRSNAGKSQERHGA